MNRMLTMTAACVLAAGLATRAAAQDYPTQTIKVISSFGAGGGSDIIARILAQRMQEKFGQNVIVENRPGAGGVLGNEAVANAPKDGYTLGVQTAGQIIASAITKNMRYDAVGAFDWVGQIATAGLFIVVRPDSPYKDIKSLVAAAKANPGKIVFGSPGFAATQHLAGELFKQIRRHRNAARALSHLARGARRAALQERRCGGRYHHGAARSGRVRPGHGARSDRQGSASRPRRTSRR